MFPLTTVFLTFKRLCLIVFDRLLTYHITHATKHCIGTRTARQLRYHMMMETIGLAVILAARAGLKPAG